MEALIAQIERVWPKCDWSVSRRSDGQFIGSVTNGATIGTKQFAEGLAEASDPADALDKAFRIALHRAALTDHS
jgi:hypothetical protein